MADRMEKTIQDKLAPLLENTNRRARMAARARQDGKDLQFVQIVLYKLAEAWWEKGIDPTLAKIKNKSQIQILMRGKTWDKLSDSERKSLQRTGIKGDEYPKLREKCLGFLEDPSFQARKKEQEKLEKIKVIENKCFGTVPGYYPTPPKIQEKLIELAAPSEGDVVVEPSAGGGHLATAIAKHSNRLLCYEKNLQLRELLRLKGFKVSDCEDWLQENLFSFSFTKLIYLSK